MAPRCKSPWTEARISGCEWFQKLTSYFRRCGVGVIVDSRRGLTQTIFAFGGPNVADVLSECSSRRQGKSEKIASNALLRIRVIGSQRSVRIAAPSLPPHYSRPATREFQSSILVELLLRVYHLDVQGLLRQQLLSSAIVQCGGLLPVDRVVVLPCMSTTADFLIIPFSQA